MFQQPTEINFKLPPWIEGFAQRYRAISRLEERVAWVVAASRKIVEEGTGGPFAAAIFERKSGVLISLGVNLVTTEGISTLHAEMVAIAIAQRKLGSYDLDRSDLPDYELVTSTEPCAMCLGAIPWSGVRHVAMAANEADAEAIGFDEGDKPAQWVQTLESRSIEVSQGIARDEAREVLQFYRQQGGAIYNGGGE